GPSGRLHRNILSSFAQFEREQMVERVTSGLHAKARAGWWPGGPPPVGYRLVGDGRRHRLAIDEREADAIRVAVAVLVDEGARRRTPPPASMRGAPTPAGRPGGATPPPGAPPVAPSYPAPGSTAARPPRAATERAPTP